MARSGRSFIKTESSRSVGHWPISSITSHTRIKRHWIYRLLPRQRPIRETSHSQPSHQNEHPTAATLNLSPSYSTTHNPKTQQSQTSHQNENLTGTTLHTACAVVDRGRLARISLNC